MAVRPALHPGATGLVMCGERVLMGLPTIRLNAAGMVGQTTGSILHPPSNVQDQQQEEDLQAAHARRRQEAQGFGGGHAVEHPQGERAVSGAAGTVGDSLSLMPSS